jgi:hypothetical protein
MTAPSRGCLLRASRPRKGIGIEAVDWSEDETDGRLITIATLSAFRAAGRPLELG